MSLLSTVRRPMSIFSIVGQNKIYRIKSNSYMTRSDQFKQLHDQIRPIQTIRQINRFSSFTPTIYTNQYISNESTKFKQYLTEIEHQLKNIINSNSYLSKLSAIFFDLVEKLNKLKLLRFTDNNDWKKFIEFIHNQHPQLFRLFHPLTNRSFNQTRGYASDAVTMDIIYKQSFRDQAQFIGKYIDNLYETKQTQLNVLNGNIREVESCKQFWNGNIKVFALDQDSDSLDMIKKDYIDKGYPVIPIQSKIKKLFDMRFQNELLNLYFSCNDMKFDLVYDYLNDKSSKSSTKQLFEMVASNGKLLIGNCLNTMCCGYMEYFKFMNWTLTYRNIQEIRECASEINPDEILEIKEFQFECFAFIEITKK